MMNRMLQARRVRRKRGQAIRAAGLALGMVAAAFLTGCWTTPSLHPLYTDDLMVFETALLGTWFGKVENSKVSFTLEPWNADPSDAQCDACYKVSLNIDEKVSWYRGVLTEIDDQLYFDITPDGREWETVLLGIELASPYLVFPMHGVYRFSLDGELLRVEYFLEYASNGIKSGELDLAHEAFGAKEDLLVTASTAELRDFIARHGSEESVFAEVGTFERVVLPDPNLPTPKGGTVQ